MPNKNELLKDIAVALGATVTDKDNDTNELLALIRDNLPSNEPAEPVEPVEPMKLYKHYLEITISNTTFSSNPDKKLTGYFTIYSSSQDVISTTSDLQSHMYCITTDDYRTYYPETLIGTAKPNKVCFLRMSNTDPNESYYDEQGAGTAFTLLTENDSMSYQYPEQPTEIYTMTDYVTEL